VQVGNSPTVILDRLNEVQPDLLARITIEGVRSSEVTADDFLSGPPEFVFEIASSSASYDLHAKRRVYERAGVREYWVWRTRDGAIDAWRLEEGQYIDIGPDEAGLIHSRVFPGLVLDRAAMLADDLARVIELQMAQHGGPAHAAFLAELAETEE
jgi:Uma2 family endonuclease